MAPSRNFRSAERKSSEASPKKGQAVHGHKMSFGTPKKDSHEASGSMIKTSTTKMVKGLFIDYFTFFRFAGSFFPVCCVMPLHCENS